MASAEYIAAAKQETREPVVLLSVEDVDAETTFYTTQSDWAGSATLTNINTSETPGSALPREELTGSNGTTVTGQFVDASGPTLSTGGYKSVQFTNPFDSYIYDGGTFTMRAGFGVRTTSSVAPPSSLTATVKIEFYTAETGGTKLGETSPVSASFTRVSSGRDDSEISPRYYKAHYLSAARTFTVNGASSKIAAATGTIYARATYTVNPSNYLSGYDTVLVSSSVLDIVPEDSVNATLTTSTIDLGAVPTNNPTLNIDDIEPANAVLTYTAVGGNVDPPVTSLGAVVDGDSLTAYRYYRITANFASTGGRAQLDELSLTEGLFRYYGTHIDSPFQGINPYIVKDSVSSLKGEIKLDKGTATVGEISLKLLITPETNDLIATGFLKGKDVQVTAGFVGLDTSSYEPVITGSIQDVNIDPNKSEVTLKIRAILKQFEKRKLPTVTYNASGDNTGTSITYAGDNIATVIKDIYDKVGIRDRYVHADYDTLETAWTTESPLYDVWRTLNKTKPIEAWKLLDELAQTAGIWLVPLGNGQIKPKVYNRNEAATITLDADEMKYSKIDLLYKDFFTRFIAYYNDTTSTDNDSPAGTNAEDFDNAKFLFDATAETLFSPEKGQKDHFDQWRVGRATLTGGLATPPTALTDLVDRWNGWYSDPLYSFEGKDLPPRFASVDPGDIVTINNLPLPVPADDWDSGTTYDKGERVTHEGFVYLSIQGTNLDKEPEANPAYWANLGIAYVDEQEGRRGYTNGMRFLVMSRTFNPNKATIDFKFLQMPYAELGAFDEDAYSTAFDSTG